MLISSCRYDCETFYADVKVGKYAIDIDFEQKPVVLSNCTTSFSGTLNTDNNGALNVGIAQNITGTLTSSNSYFTTVGYRLFFYKGYLKCLKKEISSNTVYYNTVSVGTSNIIHVPVNKVKCSFYHPAAIWECVYDPGVKKIIQDRVVLLANQFGIEVPKEFHQDVGQYDGADKARCLAALDWLAYPMVREINSPTVCDNMVHEDRTYLAPKFEPMSFKQLVEHYYGCSTGKLLSEVWKIVTVGCEYSKRIFGVPEARTAYFSPNTLHVKGERMRILEDNGDHLIQVGDRCIRVLTFSFGSAIFKKMGFDYFYQSVPLFNAIKTPSRYIGLVAGPSAIEFELATLLKFVSPKKLLSILFDDAGSAYGPDSILIHDTAQMLRTYDGVEKIPRQLRLQYPLGLRVDFKFKSIKELHDKISTQYTIIQTESTKKEILISDLYAQLDGREFEGCKLVVPTNTSTLAIWGKLLSICIASYGDRAADGKVLLLGVEKEGRIKYCIEFHTLTVPEPEIGKTTHLYVPYPKLLERHVDVTPTDTSPEDEIYHIPSMVQFRGMHNGDPAQEDRNAVEHMLVEWTKENFAFLSQLKGIFSINEFFGYGYNDNYVNANVQGAVLNAEILQNAANLAAQQIGQPDHFILNPNDARMANNYMDYNVGINRIAVVGNVIINP